MKKMNLFAILSMLAILLVSCGGVEENDPAEELDETMEEAMSGSEDAVMDDEEVSAEEAHGITEEDDADSDEDDGDSDEDDGDSDEDDGDSEEGDAILDGYESFADDYIAILKKQNADPTDMSIMTEYQALMPKASKWSGQMATAAASFNPEQVARMLAIQAKLSAAAMP